MGSSASLLDKKEHGPLTATALFKTLPESKQEEANKYMKANGIESTHEATTADLFKKLTELKQKKAKENKLNQESQARAVRKHRDELWAEQSDGQGLTRNAVFSGTSSSLSGSEGKIRRLRKQVEELEGRQEVTISRVVMLEAKLNRAIVQIETLRKQVNEAEIEATSIDEDSRLVVVKAKKEGDGAFQIQTLGNEVDGIKPRKRKLSGSRDGNKKRHAKGN